METNIPAELLDLKVRFDDLPKRCGRTTAGKFDL
jgi:hypothetical protein